MAQIWCILSKTDVDPDSGFYWSTGFEGPGRSAWLGKQRKDVQCIGFRRLTWGDSWGDREKYQSSMLHGSAQYHSHHSTVRRRKYDKAPPSDPTTRLLSPSARSPAPAVTVWSGLVTKMKWSVLAIGLPNQDVCMFLDMRFWVVGALVAHILFCLRRTLYSICWIWLNQCTILFKSVGPFNEVQLDSVPSPVRSFKVRTSSHCTLHGHRSL